MAVRISTETPTTVNLRDDEGYRRAADRLADLTGRAESLDRRRGELVTGLSRVVDPGGLEARARLLLQDDAVPLGVAEQEMRKSLAAIEDELAVTRKAAELQTRIVEQERSRVSRDICARLRPQHRAIVARIAGAIAALDAALADEQILREALNDSGVIFTTSLRPMPFHAAGRLDDTNSAAAAWMRDAHAAGLLD